MPIPDYETLMLPLLRIPSAANGSEVQLLSAIGHMRGRCDETIARPPSALCLGVFVCLPVNCPPASKGDVAYDAS